MFDSCSNRTFLFEYSIMKRVERYIAINFLRAASIVLLLLLALFSFVELGEELEDTDSGVFTTADAISVTVLTTPERTVNLLPISALFGAVLGLGAMANHREIIALRSAGLSAWTLTRAPCLMVGGLIVFISFTQNYVIPIAEKKAQEFRAKKLTQTSLAGDAEYWSRHGNQFIRVGSVDFGRIPRDIEIYELGSRGRLRHMMQANKADILGQNKWLLHDVQKKILADGSVRSQDFEVLEWQSFLSKEQLSVLRTPAHALSPVDLFRYIRETKGSGVSTREYEAIFWHQLSIPLSVIAMTLLGLPFVIGAVGTRSAGSRIVLGSSVGIGFYLLEQMSAHLSVIIGIPAAPAALAPATLVLIGGLAGLKHLR